MEHNPPANQKVIVPPAGSLPEPQPKPQKTTIQILKATADSLTECKTGNDTYDSVINRHMAFYKEKAPKS